MWRLKPPHKVKVKVKGGGNPYLWGRIPSGCGDFLRVRFLPRGASLRDAKTYRYWS
ncbi:MAG: hypothetical protein LBH93_04585 [Chitinispirillales bacterium]|nr:hypothetical protein [Chitinispirillales bacterium]